MPTTTHPVAILEDEGLMLVEVDPADIDEYGADKVLRFVSKNRWVREQDLDVVLCFEDERGDLELYGDEDSVARVEALSEDDLDWDAEVYLDWSELDGGGANRLNTAPRAANSLSPSNRSRGQNTLSGANRTRDAERDRAPARQPKPAQAPRGRTSPARPLAAAAGAALSHPDLQEQVDRLRELQRQIPMAPVHETVAQTERDVASLAGRLAELRSRGYVFRHNLERQADALAQQWREARQRLDAALSQQTQAMQADAARAQALLDQGASAEAALSSLEGQVEAVQDSADGQTRAVQEGVTELQSLLEGLEWAQTQAEQASFGLLATEAVVDAVAARWIQPGADQTPEGVLFLTDQRLLFEQKQDLAVKKVLFIATETKKVQGLKWEAPVAHVEKAVGSVKGFLGKDDYLTLTFASEASLRTAELHLQGRTGDEWSGLIGRVKSGEIAKERTVPVDQKAVEAQAKAPTKCAVCGATLTQTVLRGQTEITCAYCGSKTRI